MFFQDVCGELGEFLTIYSYAETAGETEESEEVLLLWIEKHLLDHSLFACIKCARESEDQHLLKTVYKGKQEHF